MIQFRMRFPGGKIKAFTMSYDDNVEQDVKLIEIMRKNGIKGTFNISSGEYPPEGHKWPEGQIHRRMTFSECKKAYEGDDIEIAIHGTHHPFWDSQPTHVAMWDILNDRRSLEEQYGCIVRGAAYPYGAFSDDVVDMLRLAGICYCRTVISSNRFDIPRDWLRLQATCHHNDPKLNELADRFIAASRVGEPLLFYLWGHSFEFEANNNWGLIEDLLAKIGGRDDTYYATNIEIYDYVHAFRELIFSADGKRVYNPTCTDVWGSTGGSYIYKIPANLTVEIY
ncbi:MAG: polysaccharide deacetylase family protein [Clostridiales bacterium]|nr:polysaccharide deacetylase family protein [Clostridiales bacterium]